MNKERHAYTIMVVPERKGKTAFSFRISRRRVFFILCCIGIAVISMGILIFKSVQAARKVNYFYAIIRENEEIKKENERLRLIGEKIGRMDTIAAYLGSLANLQSGASEKISLPGGDVSKPVPLKRTEPQKGDTTGGNSASEKNENPYLSATATVITDVVAAHIPSKLPVEGWITQTYVDESVKEKAKHLGIDIAAAEGKSIKAPAKGIVASVSRDQYYGILLIINHHGGYVTRYGHCHKVFVSAGDTVQQNQEIAQVGNTGHSTAPHLHYEVLKDGKNINPMDLVLSAKKK